MLLFCLLTPPGEPPTHCCRWSNCHTWSHTRDCNSETLVTTSLLRGQQNMAKASCRVAGQRHSGWPLGKLGRRQSATTDQCLAWCHIFQFLSQEIHQNNSFHHLVCLNSDTTSVTNLSCLESDQFQPQSHLQVSESHSHTSCKAISDR